jgi:hypothetical protein
MTGYFHFLYQRAVEGKDSFHTNTVTYLPYGKSSTDSNVILGDHCTLVNLDTLGFTFCILK